MQLSGCHTWPVPTSPQDRRVEHPWRNHVGTGGIVSFARTKSSARFRGTRAAPRKGPPALASQTTRLFDLLSVFLLGAHALRLKHGTRCTFGSQVGACRPLPPNPPPPTLCSLGGPGPRTALPSPPLLALLGRFQDFPTRVKTGISQDGFYICGRDLFLIRAFKSNLLLLSFAKRCSIKS